VYKHPAKYESCSSKTVGGDSRTIHVPFMQLVRKKHTAINHYRYYQFHYLNKLNNYSKKKLEIEAQIGLYLYPGKGD
jgi:hypothetical protein